jgi:hypothetical protein
MAALIPALIKFLMSSRGGRGGGGGGGAPKMSQEMQNQVYHAKANLSPEPGKYPAQVGAASEIEPAPEVLPYGGLDFKGFGGGGFK